ncbi:aldo/keto reductase family protein [Sporomusa sp.]|uniref:aldo/keto reductase family protein n=1 Tax=Sporomusa sp. TaxID=2078658 RepID=UPI002D155344|nr:aldo/keto reductase family protein [Sporomusa sp.]HWR42590.1 aldo/keto reductase family protein [Sporomusa sp.]
MQYRYLGNSGLQLSEISLGSWLTYGNTTEKETAISIIRRAYELGINSFDTANVYALGEAELLVGEALRDFSRESYVLATKAFFPMGDGINDRGLSRKHVFEQVHASLKRLQVDYVDIFYCHRYDYQTPVQETLRTIDDLIRQGKILYAGVSEWTAAQITEALGVADKYLLDRIVVNQPPYNMLNRYIEKEVVPTCEKYGISQVVFSPLAQGMLTGKYQQNVPVPPDSRAADARTAPFLQRYFLEQNFRKVQQLKAIANELEVTLANLALAWVLAQPNITSAIIGATKLEQLNENVKAVDLVLAEEILNVIETILE